MPATNVNQQIEAPSGVDISTQLPQAFLEKLGQMVVERKKKDWQDSEGYRNTQKRHLELYSGKIPGKNSSDDTILYVHLPYLTRSALLYQSKVLASAFPSSGDYLAASTMRPGTEERDRAATRFVNFALKYWIPEYVPSHDRGSMDMFIYGSAFSIWRWSSSENRPTFDFATSDTVVVPYAYRSNRVDMSDIPWFTWVLRMHRHEIEEAAANGDFNASAIPRMYERDYEEDGTAATEPQENQTTSVQETADRIMGLDPQLEMPSKPRAILWHHCFVKLPGETRQRPVEIFADEVTKTILRVTLREKDDPSDARRYDGEMQVWQATSDALKAQYESVLAEHDANVTNMAAAGIDPAELPMPPAPPPEPPMPDPIRKVPFSRITHYQCLPNPEGFYGYGIGLLIEGPNIVSDETMSLYASSLRTALSPTGIMSRDARMARGEFEIRRGKFVECRLPPEQLDKAFKQIIFPNPDPNAFKVEERMDKSVNEITADSILSGAPGRSGQTATEADLRHESAMTPITSVAARYDRSRMNEMRVLSHMLREMLPEEGFRFYNYDQQNQGLPAEEFRVGPQDFGDDLGIVFTSDPSLASPQQRERAANRALDAVQRGLSIAPGGIPPVDPDTAIMMVRTALGKVFKAMDLPNMALLIEKAKMPTPPPQPGEPNGRPPGSVGMEGPEGNQVPAEAAAGFPQ
jgi:hypothetical protein